jgi:hypothetical protein
MPTGFYKRTEEQRLKISKAMLGVKKSPEHSLNIRKGKKGKISSPLTVFQKGHKINLGKKYSLEHRKKLSDAKKGDKTNLWRGGVSTINRIIRNSLEYRLWRESVFKRDNYTCVWCGQLRGQIEADHIKPFAYYPELRFAIDNGRTLCRACHQKTDTYLKKIPIKK